MAVHVSSVSTKGQVTLPAELRHRLGIKPGDKVSISMEDGGLRVEPAASELRAGFQSIQALKTPVSLKDLTEFAAEENAVEAAREGL